MSLENESAPHLPRDLRPSGFVPPSRGTISLSSVPTSPPQNTRRVGATRRRKSTEQSVSRTRDATDQENNRVTHRRTSSIDTIRRRTSKPKKYTEAGGNETVTSFFTCAGAAIRKSKVFLPSSTTVSGLESSKLFNGKCVKKPDCVPLSLSSLAILNVGPVHVAHDIATYTTTSLFIDFSDDLARWDMDNIPMIPSVPSPPGSPRRSESPSSTYVTQPINNPNPFSTPIDDDEALEAEIPFPLNRHSKVVLENMGVKKAKTLSRSRSIASGSPSQRREPSLEADPAGCGQRQLNTGLPSPLPLRARPHSAEPQHPLHSESSRVLSQVVRSSTLPALPARSSARKDSWGCVHLGATDLGLSVIFPKSAHFEVWDMGDDAHFAVPAMLCLTVKEPAAFSGMPIALPDVSLIDIRCEDLPLPLPRVKYEVQDNYYTSYTGSNTGKMTNDSVKDTAPRTAGISMKHISLEGQWVRTYAKPGVEGVAHSRLPHPEDDTKGFRGWYQKFWVPIQTRLFEKRETRMFRIHARTWMMGDEQRVLLLDENDDGKVHPLLADAEMTVSHLRKEREMERWY